MCFKYKIKMLSDWHIGSGLDSATDANALVLKDDRGLPYIPGKTIKGLIRDALHDMVDVGKADPIKMNKIFGEEVKDENDKVIKTIPGNAFFSNAKLCEKESDEIYHNKLESFLYRNIASTAIGKKGVAEDKSLRVMQVTMPVNLYGNISGLDNDDIALLKDTIKLVRHLGVNRNRGLGRCKFTHLENTSS